MYSLYVKKEIQVGPKRKERAYATHTCVTYKTRNNSDLTLRASDTKNKTKNNLEEEEPHKQENENARHPYQGARGFAISPAGSVERQKAHQSNGTPATCGAAPPPLISNPR